MVQGAQVPARQDAAVDANQALDPITVITDAMWDAMGAEWIPDRMRRAVISRVLYGHPDGFEVGHPQYGSGGFHDYVGKKASGG